MGLLCHINYCQDNPRPIAKDKISSPIRVFLYKSVSFMLQHRPKYYKSSPIYIFVNNAGVISAIGVLLSISGCVQKINDGIGFLCKRSVK